MQFAIYEGFRRDHLGVWNPIGGDTKAAWFADPDGNVLSLVQFGD